MKRIERKTPDGEKNGAAQSHGTAEVTLRLRKCPVPEVGKAHTPTEPLGPWLASSFTVSAGSFSSAKRDRKFDFDHTPERSLERLVKQEGEGESQDSFCDRMWVTSAMGEDLGAK